MKLQTEHTVKKEQTFFIVFLLTAFFFLLEISFFIQCNETYLSDFSYVSDRINIPVTILPGILFFMGVQLAIHLAYVFYITMLSKTVIAKWQIPQAKEIHTVLSLWFLGVVMILVANQYYFPYSKFSELTSVIFFSKTLTKYSFCLLLLINACVLLSAFIYYPRILIASICLIAIAFLLQQPSQSIWQSNSPEKPNVILIGMDSLRPDFLSYFGSSNKTIAIDKFLTNATLFPEAITPLARTFPSWTGILTGNYPKHTGVRFNLASQEVLNLTNSLPAILKADGYQTIYATDETRFSNIDKNFGFDKVVSPPAGLNDFLIGTFNDFPFSNLLVNTKIGKWLFPYNYANRAAYITYEPNTFLKEIADFLPMQNRNPLFLAVHFCLPHFPYLYSDMKVKANTPIELYANSVKRVDQQVGDFLHLLKARGFLEHAVVVLLSDHGEAIELPGDRITEEDLFVSDKTKIAPRFYPQSLDNEKINESIGHGTDVLGLPQYHSLLAFRVYEGKSLHSAKQMSGVVSLLDILPTVVDLLNLPAVKTDGISLAKMINQNGSVPLQHLFLESDYTPEAIRTVYPNISDVMLQGVQIFQIDPITTKLTIKKDMGDMIIRSKQVADIYGHWMLALYPQANAKRIPILINLNTGIWTEDLQSSFAKEAPVDAMLSAIRQFYQQELL